MDRRRQNLDLLEGGITRNILILAWPVVVGMLLQTAFNIVDTYWVGKVGPEAIAAISMCFPVIFFMIAVGAGISIGVTSLVARSIGANDFEKADNAADHSLLLAASISMITISLGLASARPIFRFMGATPELMPLVLGYIDVIFVGSPFLFFFFIVNGILRGEADMVTPMKLLFVSVTLNMILDPFFIFGFRIIPRLGIKGAAIATVISRGVGCILLFYHFYRGKSGIRLSLRDFRYDFGIIWDILVVGIPTSLTHVNLSLGMFFLTKITALFGALAIAAYGLGFRLDSVAIMPVIGLSAAVITIVGQNVGAKKFARARRTAWTACGMVSLFMGSVGLIFFLKPEFWIAIFTNSLEVISMGASYLLMVALTYAFIGISIIVGGAFQGSGDAIPGLVITSIRLWIIAVPGAYLLSKISGYGVGGIWLAIAISNVVAGFISVLWLRFGRWE